MIAGSDGKLSSIVADIKNKLLNLSEPGSFSSVSSGQKFIRGGTIR